MATDLTTDTIRISAVIAAPPERIYAAWLDSEEHSAITHSTAGVEPWVGGRHSAWGGSIRGTTVELQPNRRIVQTWWASDFPPGSEESRLEVIFEPVPEGTLVTINHTGLPQGRGHRYEDGWKDFYLDSMRSYFLAHPEAPTREETAGPAGQLRMDLPAASMGTKPAPVAERVAARAKAARKPAKAKVRAKAKAKKPARARRPKAKKKAARKPVARKAKARSKRKPAKAARKRAKPARKPARAKASRARKSAGKARTRRGR